jgi:16S rRNA (cytidine1402-2'-O)-methyltransferase
MAQQHGRLFLIPSPIAEGDLSEIPTQAVEAIHSLEYFIAERVRTARRYIRSTNHPKPIDSLQFTEIPYEAPAEREIAAAFTPAMEGHDMGLMSEAGLPAIADPGGRYVAYAHQLGIQVVPLAGPSSIFMALMASGMEGQRFAFHGYLSAKKDELGRQLRDLEQRADRDDATQIFMEAPYRNRQVLESVEKYLSAKRGFCIAAGLGSANGFVITKTVEKWKKEGWPEIHKVPSVFLIK